MLQDTLISLGMEPREAKLYLAGLETGTAPASVIARSAGEKRVTAYQTLDAMVKQWWCRAVVKNHKTHYTMLDPEKLIAVYEQKTKHLKAQLPDMLGLMNQYSSKPKVAYYEGREQLKDLFCHIIDAGAVMPTESSFLTFFGVSDMDPSFEQWLAEEFIDYRLQCPTKTKSLTTTEAHPYIDYTKTHHEVRVVSDPVFDLANEIIIYGNNKVALVMYNTQELSAVVIESASFHQAMTGIFYALRNSLDN